MMSEFNRYAIYYAPEPGPLAEFGAAWLGWDLQEGCGVTHPEIEDLPRAIADLTATPRKYGLHGTIKAPIRLAEGRTPEQMADSARRLCAGLAPVTTGPLTLKCMKGFLALVPTGDLAPLSALAGACVAGLDAFRAPPTEEELAKRRKAPLSPAQEENLARWGYPYVMDDFQFHITLTGRLTPGEAERTKEVLEDHVAPFTRSPFRITSLVLAGENPWGRFQTIERFPLGRG
ncbi:DUF1045 domain-containing protein [Pseudooceanicola nanhaiensis]|uniref:DUF1045 domain-containing protein n=1 Tax=Pseudooceanicola nanhaiensis TaxID=375761 RepID=UPI00296F5758|nr:DUF1045 domain-containing protein [Pseudooceanicola nanhaiensis]